MGKTRQRAVVILGLQHQSGRCCGGASGRAGKESIASGERPPQNCSLRRMIEKADRKRAAGVSPIRLVVVLGREKPSPCTAVTLFAAIPWQSSPDSPGIL